MHMLQCGAAYTPAIMQGEYYRICLLYTSRFAEEEDAVGVVEIILILVVLIGLVIIFKEQLTCLLYTSRCV